MYSRRLQYVLPIFLFLIFGLVATWFLYTTVIGSSNDKNPNTELRNDQKSDVNCDNSNILEVSINQFGIYSN